MNKTTTPTPKDIHRDWHLLDAKGIPLGRIASRAAKLLIGKEKKNFSYHFDNGNYVVVVNTSQVGITGNKLSDKTYYRHSGYPGNLKEYSLQEMMEIDPNRVVTLAIKNMLPKNKQGSKMLTRLKVFTDNNHPYKNLLTQ